MQIRVDLVPSPPYDDVVLRVYVLRTDYLPILFKDGLTFKQAPLVPRLSGSYAYETGRSYTFSA